MYKYYTGTVLLIIVKSYLGNFALVRILEETVILMLCMVRDEYIIPVTRSYDDRLDKLGIKSLKYRRLQFDIILMFKIYHKLSDLQFDNYFEHCDRKYNFRFHNFKIKSKLCTNTEQFCNFFFTRIINVWNKLPHDLVSAPNIVIFRNHLKNFNLYSIASLTFWIIFVAQLLLFIIYILLFFTVIYRFTLFICSCIFVVLFFLTC